jgi:hypothetical protein
MITATEDKLFIQNEGYPDPDQPFTLTSRKSRDLFDQIRDPDNRIIVSTLYMFNSWDGGYRTYRTYVYERKTNHIKFMEKYTTVSAAVNGHNRHCQALGF